MIQIARSERPAHLGEPRERSGQRVNVVPSPKSRLDGRLDTVGVTRSSETLFGVVEFEMKEIVEPDIDRARTIDEMAAEQLRFNESLEEGYVDVELPYDH